MASDLLSIAASGAKAARIALDVTGQNIANASTDGYVRRSAQMQEVASAGGPGRTGDLSLSGVRVNAVIRNADAFRQAEVRRTGADAARADAEVTGLQSIETTVEQSGVYSAIVGFEGSLRQLAADPVNASLRAATIEDARTMTGAFNIASASLASAGDGLRFEASDDVTQVNRLSQELARVNTRLSRASTATSDRSSLLDQRDLLLEKLSGHIDVATTINPDQTVTVRSGGASGPMLVGNGTSYPLAMTSAADGTISFTLDGNAFTPQSGALVGRAQALTKLADIRTGLDTLASGLIATVNGAQASGAALDGSAGTAMLAGTGAGDMALAFQDGAMIATAPAGAGAGSRDPGNLDALRTALSANDPAGAMDALLFDISSTVQGSTVTRDTIDSIASTAKIALSTQAGVDLDAEAANLVRYQQAFQASGRVMQVANDLLNTLLGIR